MYLHLRAVECIFPWMGIQGKRLTVANGECRKWQFVLPPDQQSSKAEGDVPRYIVSRGDRRLQTFCAQTRSILQSVLLARIMPC